MSDRKPRTGGIAPKMRAVRKAKGVQTTTDDNQAADDVPRDDNQAGVHESLGRERSTTETTPKQIAPEHVSTTHVFGKPREEAGSSTASEFSKDPGPGNEQDIVSLPKTAETDGDSKSSEMSSDELPLNKKGYNGCEEKHIVLDAHISPVSKKVTNQITKISDLHDSVITQILSRLPLKSILSSKRVLKNWKALISDSEFARCYMANSPYFSILISRDYHLSCSIELRPDREYVSLTQKQMYEENTLDLQNRLNSRYVVIGSCKGILCLEDDDRYFICNPVMGEIHGFDPPSGIRSPYGFALGFGYNTLKQEFKMVLITKKGDGTEVVTTWIKTIGVESKWRDIGVSLYPGNKYGVFLHDALHWVKEDSIFSFGLSEENWKSVKLPKNFNGLNDVTVVALKEYLAVYTIRSSDLDIYKMKIYMNSDSWKNEKISLWCMGPDRRPIKPVPITMWRDGETLLVTRAGKLITYDPDKKKKKKRSRVTDLNVGDYKASVYVPNFQSLKVLMGQGLDVMHLDSKEYLESRRYKTQDKRAWFKILRQ